MISLEPLQALLDKPMDRKQFLKHMAAVVVSVVGVGAFIKTLSNPLAGVQKQPKTAVKATRGYGGGSAYGV